MPVEEFLRAVAGGGHRGRVAVEVSRRRGTAVECSDLGEEHRIVPGGSYSRFAIGLTQRLS
jgi:hypothetical protein